MVVSSALRQIPAQLRDKVVAVVLYGAGDGSGVAKEYFNKALANCAPGDFVSPVVVWQIQILTVSGLPECRERPGARFLQQQGNDLARPLSSVHRGGIQRQISGPLDDAQGQLGWLNIFRRSSVF
jgi:hypothetical protein